jgi:hypothetical protein
MAEAAEAKPVVEFTKVRRALLRRLFFVVVLFLSSSAPFSSSVVVKEGKKKYSLGGDHLSKNRIYICCITRGALTFISLSLLSKPSRHTSTHLMI